MEFDLFTGGTVMRNVKRSRMTAIVSIAFVFMTGCATQSEPDEYATVQPSCPHNLKMQCFERRGQVTKCSCVTPGEIEQMLEDLTNLEIQ